MGTLQLKGGGLSPESSSSTAPAYQREESYPSDTQFKGQVLVEKEVSSQATLHLLALNVHTATNSLRDLSPQLP